MADLDNEFFNNNNYFNIVTTFFNCQTELIKIIKDNLNNYNIHMAEACKHLEEIENGFSRLSDYFNKANLVKDICNVFEQYQIFFKNWKRLHINQSSIIRSKLNEYLKYLKNNGFTLNELFKRKNIV